MTPVSDTTLTAEAGENTHRAHGDLLRNILRLVDVDLVEVDALGLLGKLLEDGRDLPARAAPRRPEIEHCGLVALNLRGALTDELTDFHVLKRDNIRSS